MSAVPSDASSPTANAPRLCPACGASSPGGRFCADCGAPFEGALCAACRSSLTAGARFCHRCGTAVGAPAPSTHTAGTSHIVPWAVTSIALFALVGLVVGRNLRLGMGAMGGSAEQTAGASPVDQAVAGDAPFTPGAAAPGDGGGAGDAGPGGVIRAPDISAMSPRDRADHLYDRVMRLAQEGKTDSVEFFSPMVMSAYAMMAPLDADAHYDLGRIGDVTGVNALARAEADTILRRNPTHLLGLALAARAASSANRSSAARAYYRRLLDAAPAELAKQLPEYTRHHNDIEAALAEARKMGISS
jgi:Double zinc ribbon